MRQWRCNAYLSELRIHRRLVLVNDGRSHRHPQVDTLPSTYQLQ